MTVRRLLSECDSAELTEWQAMYALDPWGEERADMRMGNICATLANINRTKGQAVSGPADWMPDFLGAKKAKRQTPEQMIAAARLMAGA